MEKFWAVWRKTGGNPPTRTHTSKEAAIQEAARLVRQSGGEEYYILEVVGYVRPKVAPTEYVEL